MPQGRRFPEPLRRPQIPSVTPGRMCSKAAAVQRECSSEEEVRRPSRARVILTDEANLRLSLTNPCLPNLSCRIHRCRIFNPKDFPRIPRGPLASPWKNVTDTPPQGPGTRTVLMRRQGKKKDRPQWTRHVVALNGRTVCGVRPSMLHRANDGDPELSAAQVRDCKRCLKLTQANEEIPVTWPKGQT